MTKAGNALLTGTLDNRAGDLVQPPARVFVAGIGAVSPAGWGVGSLVEAAHSNLPLAIQDLVRPGWTKPLRVRRVPPAPQRSAFSAHPRLRRASPITQFAVAAAVEAMGGLAPDQIVAETGIILCAMSGCVNYSNRFYDETLRDPATASPLVFPETVFNAPSSHLAAVLGSTAINYTLVGDPGTFLQGLALAAEWLTSGLVRGCVVIGAEEIDWVTADAFRLFSRRFVLSEGAGAVYLRSTSAAVELTAVTEPYLFLPQQSLTEAAANVRQTLPLAPGQTLLCDSQQGVPKMDGPETAAWNDWQGPRVSPKKVWGEGLTAASAWQTVLAIDALQQSRYTAANVTVLGCNQQAIGAQFRRTSPEPIRQ